MWPLLFEDRYVIRRRWLCDERFFISCQISYDLFCLLRTWLLFIAQVVKFFVGGFCWHTDKAAKCDPKFECRASSACRVHLTTCVPVIRLNNINDAPRCNGTFEKGDCCLCVYLVYVRARLSLSLSLSVYLFSLSYRSFFMVILLHLPNIRLLHHIKKDEKWQWIFHMASDERTCVYVCLLNVRVSRSFVECHFVGNMYLMFQNMSQWPLFTFLFNSCTVRWEKKWRMHFASYVDRKTYADALWFPSELDVMQIQQQSDFMFFQRQKSALLHTVLCATLHMIAVSILTWTVHMGPKLSTVQRNEA